MIAIKNMQAEPVKILLHDSSFIIQGNTTVICEHFNNNDHITVSHCSFSDENENISNKIISNTVKSFFIIVDSSYTVKNISPDACIEIYNSVYEHSISDFAYLYFGIISQNCSCELLSCKGINTQKVLNSYKLLFTGDAFDFPPFSIVKSIQDYNKIKKLCNDKTILTYIKSQNHLNA